MAMEQFALCDVVMTQIKVSGGTTHSFATADEISCEPVIEEGESKNLTIKNKLIASFLYNIIRFFFTIIFLFSLLNY